MTTPTSQQPFETEFSSLQSAVSRLQHAVRLNHVRGVLERLDTDINNLPGRIATLRSQGYAFENTLEAEASHIQSAWPASETIARAEIETQTGPLVSELRLVEAQLNHLATLRSNPAQARPLMARLQTAVQTLQSKTDAAERTVLNSIQPLRAKVSTLHSRLEKIEWMMKQLAEACFKLLATESGIMAVKAVWCQDVKERPEDPDGVLYLTDQRLIFEQKEEIATKKVLFITTAKEKVQALRWEIPIALLQEVKPSKQGLLKNEDHLDLRFAPGASLQTVHLHIWQDANEWVQLLNRAHTRDFDQTRALKIDETVQEKVKSAPSQCPSCGANITQTVLRGMDSLKCEYCGYTIRL
ncbi:MAG: hypothetical protein DDG60_05495 [Anaerolineae bacterium]|nr:MAG: hypothetical protein DDG60_05495 [Anaerolineae bacterium]